MARPSFFGQLKRTGETGKFSPGLDSVHEAVENFPGFWHDGCMSIIEAIRNYLSRARAEAEKAHRMAASDGAEKHAGPTTAAPVLWTGVDLDGTLARFDQGSSLSEIGPPVPLMLERVRSMIANGERVKIVTARAADPDQVPLIRKWLRDNGLPPLEITDAKDYNMIRLYDDRAVQVERNTGRIIPGAAGKKEDPF
jgi:hypothetical protein